MVLALAWGAFVVGVVGTWVLMLDRGYRPGMRIAWFLATLAIPAWLFVFFRSLTFDAVSGVGYAVVLATLVRPYRPGAYRAVLADGLIVLVVLAGVVSDAYNRLIIPGSVIDLVRFWVFPYLVGRLCFGSWEELRPVLPYIAVPAAGLAVFAVIESLSHRNLLADVTGKVWVLLDRGEGFRWGLKRAQGTTNHPIYFGLLLALILPWLLVAAREAWAGRGPGWWKWTPFAVAIAAFITVARSAHVAVIMVVTADLFFRRRSFRAPMIALAVASGMVFFAFRVEILDMLGAYAGESGVGDDSVKIYGVEHPYTGTRHRDLLQLAYEDAIASAGWIGYGTELRDMPKDPNMDRRFLSIDHQYLIHFLKYGYVGSATFGAFGICIGWYLARAAWSGEGHLAQLAGGLFGGFVAVALMIRGVALSPDFGAMWLFVAGFAASMHGRRATIEPGVAA